ncbi:hypothetical protein [Burkholderia ubonensis]|uniref:hypothetical protein n=1 Tax=Burkholderia ubonensis TaxID=101571 RepID=UPI001E3C2D55|nr:hypothetical protein [Burkholderia ubonensis]
MPGKKHERIELRRAKCGPVLTSCTRSVALPIADADGANARSIYATENVMASGNDSHFKLRRPCENCPFLKVGAIELAPGRLDGIVDALLRDDRGTFHCHKTVHNERTGGEWDGDGNYVASGHESMCAGAMIYLEKLGRPTVGMRLGRVLGLYDAGRLRPAFADVIDPRDKQRENRDDEIRKRRAEEGRD